MNPFAESMGSRTDAELVEIVTADPEDWQADAIAAAKAEIEKRGITADQREELETKVIRDVSAAQRPLSRSMKLITILFGGLCLPGIAVLYLYTQYQKSGEHRKSRELLRYFVYGLGIHIAILLVIKCR